MARSRSRRSTEIIATTAVAPRHQSREDAWRAVAPVIARMLARAFASSSGRGMAQACVPESKGARTGGKKLGLTLQSGRTIYDGRTSRTCSRRVWILRRLRSSPGGKDTSMPRESLR